MTAQWITDVETLDAALAEHPALMVYVQSPGCGACHALWPRLAQTLAARYPRLMQRRVDAETTPELAARLQAYTVPTAILFFEGREHHRFSRAFGINEIGAAIDRPYRLLFDASD